MPDEPVTTVPMLVGLPMLSVNVADAVSWEDWPVAVARNVAPINSREKTYQLVWKLPFASATTSHGWNDCWIGDLSRPQSC